MPVVVVVVGADQMAVGGLLVVRHQVFVREALEGQTRGRGGTLTDRSKADAAAREVCGAGGECCCLSPGGRHLEDVAVWPPHGAAHLHIPASRLSVL